MIKLVLAEDEALEMRYLRRVVEESSLSLSVVGEARDGEEAVRLSRRHQPDILIMDVKMPVMDGLAATRLIKQELPATAVIIISAYEEFAFAWEALKLGACEYLLKPVEQGEILSALQVALAQNRAQSRGSGREKAQEWGPVNLTQLEAGLVWDLSMGRASKAQVESRQKLLEVALAPASWLLVEIPQSEAFFGPQVGTSSTTATPSIRKTWEEFLDAYQDCLQAWVGENRLAIIAGRYWQAEDSNQLARRDLLQRQLEERFGPLCFGISATCSDPLHLSTFFQQALEMLNAQCQGADYQHDQTMVGRAVAFMEENYQQALSLEDVARQVHVSPFHLSRMFKHETGFTFVEYLTRLRTSSAKILLRTTDYSIKVIGKQVGFREAGYFSKVFRKCEGVSPSRYRSLFDETEPGTRNPGFPRP